MLEFLFRLFNPFNQSLIQHMKKILLTGLLLLLAVAFTPAQTNFTRVEDVIYGRKFGTALTLDVFQPTQPNGYGVAMMVSGGWFSAHEAINPIFFKPLLDRGYTVFAVVHGSNPKFIITEIVPDIHRAIRFIRHNAKKYGVNPDKLGITGGSAGGHLSLTMAVKGAKGDEKAKDPIDRLSSEIQCVACFYPPTDFLNYGEPGEDAVGVGTLKGFKTAFGPRSDTAEGRQALGREISPIYFVRSNQAPILIIHGDADKLVPIYQAEKFVERSKEAGAVAKLITRPGKGHGWDITNDLKIFADWFDEHLRGVKSAAGKSP
jgi:acetyl esterase/lipase